MNVARSSAIATLGAALGALALSLVITRAESMTRVTGWWALSLVVLTLAVSPLRRLLSARRRASAAVIAHRARRSIGLVGAAVASYHLFEALEHYFGAATLGDSFDAALALPWLRHGALALALLWILALTSLRVIARRLDGWTALHRLIYPLALLGTLHASFAPHAGVAAFALAIVVVLLLIARLVPAGRKPTDREPLKSGPEPTDAPASAADHRGSGGTASAMAMRSRDEHAIK